MNEYDAEGRPLLLSIRVLKDASAEGLVLEAGQVVRILLRIALKLIILGICERKNPQKSKSRNHRQRVDMSLEKHLKTRC